MSGGALLTAGEAFTALGYLVGALVFYIAAKERKLATDGMQTLALVGFAAGILGAKVTQYVFSGGEGGSLLASGRALLGGVVFGWLGVEIAKRRMGIRRSTGDLFALALPAGEAVGRIGCFLNPCCIGTKCDLPWAVNQVGELRHPVQLYSAAVSAVLFAFLWIRRKSFPQEGDLFRLYLVLFGLSRFGLEFLRDGKPVWLGLSMMQLFCLELVVSAVIWQMVRNRRLRQEAV